MTDARVDRFLDKNDFVCNLPSLNEASLIFRDDGGQHVFNPVGDDLGDDFVANVAKRDGLKSIKGGSPFLFGDER